MSGKRMTFLAVVMLIMMLASGGCGGGSGGSVENMPKPIKPIEPPEDEDYLSGNFTVGGRVEGLTYACSPSGLSGTTCSKGSFNYELGDKIVFKAGNVSLPQINAQNLIYPLTYFPGKAFGDSEVLNFTRFIMSAGTVAENGNIKTGEKPFNGKTGTFPGIWPEFLEAGEIKYSVEQAQLQLGQYLFAIYVGTYKGTWQSNSGGGAGAWEVVIESDGKISGSYSGTLNGSMTGAVNVDGDVTMTTSGGYVWSGRINTVTGELNGTYSLLGVQAGTFKSTRAVDT